MKLKVIYLCVVASMAILVATSCSKDAETITIDSALPNGSFSVERSGVLVAESGTPTEGTVEIGTDEGGVNFLHFGNDFMTELATGTVSIYFSTSETFMADPGMGNPDLRLVGAVKSNGEQYIKLETGVPSNFTHVILWCNTASIPFGNASF